MNALKYWKNNQLLDYTLDDKGNVNKIEFVNNFALYAGGVYDDNTEEEKEKPMIDNKEYFKKIEKITGLSLKPHEINEIISHIEEIFCQHQPSGKSNGISICSSDPSNFS